MNAPSHAYVPVLCEFHDHLEAMATTRKSVRITFTDTAGIERLRVATIADVYAREGAEYLATESGETIRLDQLIAVDDVSPSHC